MKVVKSLILKRSLFLIAILMWENVNSQKISIKEANEDFEFLITNIKKYNPVLSIYNKEFDKNSLGVTSDLKSDSLSVYEYFAKVSQICALSNEGHFSLGKWTDIAHKSVVENQIPYIPISIKIIDEEIYVIDDYSNEQILDRGSQVLSINRRKSNDVLEQLVKFMPSDGDIRTYSYRKIEEGFAYLYLFYIERSNNFEIEYLDRNKEFKICKIKGLLRSEQVDNYRKYRQISLDPVLENRTFYQLDYQKDYAILTLPSFDRKRVERFGIKSKKMYKRIFKQLEEKKVEHLIIDLRNNTGGLNKFADDIVPFVIKTKHSDGFLRKTVSWHGKEKSYKMPKTSKLVFKGKIYALVNGKTFSAGASLARFLKEYSEAIIVGEETGTRYEGFAAGSSQIVTLSNSKIDIGIPRYHIFYPKSDKQRTSNRGLIPDYKVENSITDVLLDLDRPLEKVKAIIKSYKN